MIKISNNHFSGWGSKPQVGTSQGPIFTKNAFLIICNDHTYLQRIPRITQENHTSNNDITIINQI